MRSWAAATLILLLTPGCSNFVVHSNERALGVAGASDEFGGFAGTFPVEEQYVTGRLWPLSEDDQAAVLEYLQRICISRGQVFDLNDLAEPKFRRNDRAWSVIGNCSSEEN